jgi:hypothetical protein
MKIKKISYLFYFFTNMQANQVYEMAEMLLKRWKPSDKFEMELKMSKYEKLVKLGKCIMKGNVESEKAKKVMGVLQVWVEIVCGEERLMEMEKMKEFEEMYGFMPDDVEAKKSYVDKMFYEEEGVMPENDEERDAFFEGVEMAEMLRMGWKAKW